MMEALAPTAIAPRLIGTVSTLDGTYDLGVFSERIHDATDGWTYCLEACQNDQPVTDEMCRLGQTLRELHQCLAHDFGTSMVDSGVIAQQMLARFEAACDQVPELTDLRGPITSILSLTPSTVEVQRVHGDFHLGQALISPTGWTVIDFEGEPLKSPAERAAADAVWKDVAGLTRSLDYARNAYPDPEGAQAQRWYETARAAFLRGYWGTVELPASLLTAYEVDKAIYELIYEERNRPTWAGIPRHAIQTAIALS